MDRHAGPEKIEKQRPVFVGFLLAGISHEQERQEPQWLDRNHKHAKHVDFDGILNNSLEASQTFAGDFVPSIESTLDASKACEVDPIGYSQGPCTHKHTDTLRNFRSY